MAIFQPVFRETTSKQFPRFLSALAEASIKNYYILDSLNKQTNKKNTVLESTNSNIRAYRGSGEWPLPDLQMAVSSYAGDQREKKQTLLSFLNRAVILFMMKSPPS